MSRGLWDLKLWLLNFTVSFNHINCLNTNIEMKCVREMNDRKESLKIKM